MSDTWRRFLGAVLLIVTMGFASCSALLHVNATDGPIYIKSER